MHVKAKHTIGNIIHKTYKIQSKYMSGPQRSKLLINRGPPHTHAHKYTHTHNNTVVLQAFKYEFSTKFFKTG